MFDRGLIAIEESYRIIAPRNIVPEQLRNVVNPSGRLILPKEKGSWPHPHYLKFHREKIFKG